MQFVGKAEYILDRKRVPIPPVYRAEFAGGGWVTTGIGPYLVLHTPDSWARAYAVIEAQSIETEEGSEIHRDFFGNAEMIQPDGQRRVQLTDDHIAHAGLEREVVVVGVGSRLEVWDRSTYEARDEQRKAARREAIGRPQPQSEPSPEGE